MRNRIRLKQRGFSIPELLMAMTISTMLLLATMMALSASFDAFQKTTRTASTGVSGRVVLERIQTLIRTGIDFGPLPADPLTRTMSSDSLEISIGDGSWVTLEWDASTQTLFWSESGGSWPLLQGVSQLVAEGEDPVAPFTLEFRDGRWLERAVIDLVVEHDQQQRLVIEGDENKAIRLIGSAMPRVVAWQ